MSSPNDIDPVKESGRQVRAVHTRSATADDLEAVLPVLRAVRSESPLGPQLVHPDAGDIRSHLAAWFSQDDTHLVLAEIDEEIIGAALAQVIDVNLFSDVAYLQMEALFVQPEFRRRGAGRALMSQLAIIAARAGAEHVVTLPVGSSRSEQRLLSGLGFTAVGARRMTPTAALLRRLEKGRERRGRSLDDLIARRRRSRGLPPTPPLGVSLEELAEREAISGQRVRDR